jgi:hypothetical protein
MGKPVRVPGLADRAVLADLEQQRAKFPQCLAIDPSCSFTTTPVTSWRRPRRSTRGFFGCSAKPSAVVMKRTRSSIAPVSAVLGPLNVRSSA